MYRSRKTQLSGTRHTQTAVQYAAATQSRNAGANSDSGSIHRLSELKPGMKVVHFKFGSGTIISLDSKDIGDVAIVQFNNENTPRQLLLKFARFTIQD